MADVEKVIKGLECCTISDEELKCPDTCPYYDECWEDEWVLGFGLIKDALELLKPAKAVRMHNTKVKDIGEKVFVANCNNCSGYLIEGWKACPICGKAVKWE